MRPALSPTLALSALSAALLTNAHLTLTTDFGGYDPNSADAGLFCLITGLALAYCACLQWRRAANVAATQNPAGFSRRKTLEKA